MIKDRLRSIKNTCKKIVRTPDRLVETVKLSCNSQYNSENMLDLAIVAIIKNEGQYIEEWVRYHIVAGVQKFYLYDNDSTDNTKAVLQKYVDAGYVELIPFPGVARQLPAYNNAIAKYRYDCKCIAFIDADEFLYSCNRQKTVREYCNEIFNSYPNIGGLAINWRMFGSSGLIDKPERGGVLDNFLYRAKEDGRGNDCIKTIVNPRKVYAFEHVHYPTYIYGAHSIDENGNIVTGWSHPSMIIEQIRINHYFTKSKEEWIERRKIGKADAKDRTEIRSLEDFKLHDNNDIYDDGMLYYLEKMKNLKI